MAQQKLLWLRSAWVTTALTVAIGVAMTGGALMIPQPAQAVHDEPTPFQLDGNPTKSLGGGNPPVSLLDDDWDNVFSLPEPYTTPRGIPDDSGDGDSFVADGANLPGGKESSSWTVATRTSTRSMTASPAPTTGNTMTPRSRQTRTTSPTPTPRPTTSLASRPTICRGIPMPSTVTW